MYTARLVRESMARCVGYLAGDAYANERLIMPEGEMGDELAVLGATVWGSHSSRSGHISEVKVAQTSFS